MLSVGPTPDVEPEARVPTVRVNLVQSVRLLPHQSLVVEICFAGDMEVDDSEAYLLEPKELKSGLQVEPSLLSLSAEGGVLSNHTGCSMALEEGSLLGEATPVTLVDSAPNADDQIPEESDGLSVLRWIQIKSTAWRQKKLLESIGSLETLTSQGYALQFDQCSGCVSASHAAVTDRSESPICFAAVYIDDALVFSPTLKEHLDHLTAVIQRVNESNSNPLSAVRPPGGGVPHTCGHSTGAETQRCLSHSHYSVPTT